MVHTGRVDRAELLQPAARIPVEGDDVLGQLLRRSLGGGERQLECAGGCGHEVPHFMGMRDVSARCGQTPHALTATG